jgi:hypothetical protein
MNRQKKDIALLGVEVKCLEEQLDSNDPAAVLLRAIKLAEPEMENKRRAINTKMGIERAKSEGRYMCGKAPLGYAWVRDQKNRPIITPSLDASLILEAFQTYATGLYSIDQVWKQLMEKGLKISRSQFHALLRNPTYAEKVSIKGEEKILIDGVHQAIVPFTELEGKLLKIEEMYFQDGLEADSYKRLKTRASEDLYQAHREIERLLVMDTNFMKYCRYGMTLLTHLDVYYAEGSLEIKRKLLGSIFSEKLVFENGS